jgi:hypothetical protein
VRRAESVSKAKLPEEISNQQSAISNQQSATNMNGGWTIPAAAAAAAAPAHIWALNGFSEEIDMGHEGKRLSERHGNKRHKQRRLASLLPFRPR